MELKEGMYVRTKDGSIDKIFEITEEWYERGNDKEEKPYKIYKLREEYYDEEFNEDSKWVFAEFIKKASYNIIDLIDLIEEKDFCEIEFYSERYKERVKRIFEVGYVARGEQSHISFENAHCQLDIINGEWSKHDKCLNPEIKSIVTKEQFSQMEYKVGGNE